MKDAKGGGIVAVVDDDQSVRDATECFLRSTGYPAEGFASAEAFLSCSHHLEFSCLVLDIGLPGISGLDLQQHLLTQGSRVPVIFVTAATDPQGQSQRQALQSGAIAFLPKPFDELALLSAMRAAVAP